MQRFKLHQSTSEITGHSGLALIGQALHRHTTLSSQLDKQVPLRHGICHSDVMKSYLGLLSVGKNDFEAINTIDSELFYMTALGLNELPSEATLRQRMDRYASKYAPLVAQASWDFLKNTRVQFEPLSSGHIPVDGDATQMDNSGSHKEGVSRTYTGCEGYAPMAVYLGSEGYCLELELRPGQQHVQRGTPTLLRRALKNARRITDWPLLLRLDGGNDSLDNMDVVFSLNDDHPDQAPVDFIIKWNPRQADKNDWSAYAKQHGKWETERAGKRIARFSIWETRTRKGYDYHLRRVMQVTERTIDYRGQRLLIPEIAIDGWWTSLTVSEEHVIQLYADRGISEQYHSELKTDLDIERLPSGKFATNALVLVCSMLIYNILRWIGQNGLLHPRSPRRQKAKRRRIKTVMQELMFVAARLVKRARRYHLSFGRGCRSWSILNELYNDLAFN